MELHALMFLEYHQRGPTVCHIEMSSIAVRLKWSNVCHTEMVLISITLQGTSCLSY